MQPASPLPWRKSHVVIETPVDRVQYWTIVDADGKEIDLERDHEYLLEAANAYPRLKAALDKALEACRQILRVCEAKTRIQQADAREARLFASMVADCAEELAFKLAREALEMAEGRDGDASN